MTPARPETTCPTCKGSGGCSDRMCGRCMGRGVVPVESNDDENRHVNPVMRGVLSRFAANIPK